MKLVYQHLLEAVKRHPEKTALICGEKKISYADFIGKTNAIAGMLILEGLHKGDRVLILLNDKIDLIIASYSVMCAGGIAVPVSESASIIEIQEMARTCVSSFIITSQEDMLKYPLLHDIVSCYFFFIEETTMSFFHNDIVASTSKNNHSDDNVDRITKLMNLKDDDGALILYTSGTSGHKKAVLMTHQNLSLTAVQNNRYTEIDKIDCELAIAPPTQAFGFGRMMSLLFAGKTIVLIDAVTDPVKIIQAVMKHQCDSISATSTTLSMLFFNVETLLKKIAQQIKIIELGGSVSSLFEKRKMLETFPNSRINVHYGLTEAPASTIIELRSERKKLDSVGHPYPHVEISICNEDGVHLERGQTGEIFIRGEHVMAGYFKKGLINTESFAEGNWLRTNDIGYLDIDGYLHILGRKDEIISMGKIKFSLFELEEKIHEKYPDYEICVVGIPDPAGLLGEIPVLCYVTRNSKTIIPSELSAALSSYLDMFKIPRIVYRMDRFPKSGNKILRQELKRQLLDGILQPATHMVEEN